MKNLKKVLAMVLAFACTFSMFAGAKVFEDVPAGSDYSEAITMLSDLGVIQGKDDGKYHPEDTITRAEACAMIARLMTGDPNVSQYVGAQSFSDVQKGSWKDSAIGYCYINGIVIGVGNNKFEPDRAITDAEFVTMVVRAMGYETADMKQNYPFSYMSNAQAIGLLDGTNMVASTDALRGEDAQVIYNALFADYARGAKLVNTTHGTSVETYPTLAESVWGLSRAAVGEWKEDKETGKDYMSTCEAHTWVVTGNVVEIDKVNYIQALPIEDGETDLYAKAKDNAPYYFKYDGDVDALTGYQVELWGEGDHSEPEYTTIDNVDGKVKGYIYSSDWNIKAIKTVKGQTAYAYNASMTDEKTDGSIKTDDIDVDLDNVQNYTKDGKLYGKLMDKKDVEKSLNVKNSTKYNLVDWDSDGSVDYIDATTYEYYEVDSVTKTKVRLKGFDGKVAMTLDVDGETSDVKIGDKEYTVKAELPTDLKEGDIIEVSMNNVAAKKELISNWTVKVVEPETKDVTEIDTKKGVEFDDELIKVADKDYTFETDGEKASVTYDNMDEDSDETWDLWRDANGFIIKMQPSDSSTGYLFVTGYEEGQNKTGKRDLMVVSGVYGDNTVAKDVELVDNAAIYLDDDKDAKNVYDKDEHALDNGVDADFSMGYASEIAGHAFRYTANDDGQITKLVRVATDEKDDAYSFNEKTDVLKANDKNHYLDESKVIFAVNSSKWTEDGATKELSTGDVLAVEYKDVPSIGDGEKTDDAGVQYDLDSDKETITAAVLGVNTFRYFGNTTNKSGLVTKMSYKPKDDVYVIEATIAGESETEFTTIDADDVDMTGVKDLDTMYDLLTKGSDAKNGLYAEMDFNADGKVIAIDLMTDTYENVAAVEDAKNADYGVARVVINRVSTSNRILTSQAISDGNGKVYTRSAQTLEQNFDITDDTKYFEVDADLEFPANGKYLNAFEDAFAKEFRLKDISEGDVTDLDSFIRTETDDDEYVVADVIYDDGDAVAVYYYKDTVKEAGDLMPIVSPEQEVYNLTIPKTGSKTYELKWSEVGGADVTYFKSVGTVYGISESGSYISDNKIVVTVPSNAQSGTIKYELINSKSEVLATITANFVYEDVQDLDYKAVDYRLVALTNDSTGVKVGNIANIAAGTTVTATADNGISATVETNGDVKVKTTANTQVGTYNIKLTASGYNDKVVTVTVDKADVALANSGSKLGNIKVSAKVGGAAIALDNTSALSVQVAKAGTTDKVDVKGTWSYDSAKGLWRFAPAADAGLVAGDTLYISLAEGANYNAAGPVVVNLAE
ncbi:S-layer homology domain-containing protein [Butyricicoccus pullicaecorum]|uniref:SLH domain-containing protein n=1 Tax=Butyricicoccus pullicaecorum TaxID=501571 RepID=A0A1Y4LZV1_9FIRM|nr:S-layer homology domain-containing protein [Butyricicoccus pullicaecorum]OUP59932.1 hypothetical protein B5F15_03730 [Butyricicoccus pullicaecorum]